MPTELERLANLIEFAIRLILMTPTQRRYIQQLIYHLSHHRTWLNPTHPSALILGAG